jgi:hypothetical protein
MIIISPKTKVGELLDAYPHLEKVLIEMSPAFEKLKNPVLRRTVARVATLQQIAIVGGLKVDSIVNRLRKETGQNPEGTEIADKEYLSTEPPDWFDVRKITSGYDASPVINSGDSPMKEILHKTKLLKSGEIFELRTPFVPAPIIDMLKDKGFKIYSARNEDVVISYITL